MPAGLTDGVSVSVSPSAFPAEFYVYQWLDVMDTENTWLEGQVISIDVNQNSFRVHYKGFHSKYDEDFLLHDPKTKQRIATLHTHTKRRHNYPLPALEPGLQLDVLDSIDKWCRAKVVDLNPRRKLAKITFLDWGPKYDEWIDYDSYRIAPLYTHTKPQPPKQKSHIQTSASSEDQYRQALRRRNLTVVDMDADGNCLFRTISHQVYGNPEYHSIIREKCMNYIATQERFFKGYIDEDFVHYVERLKYNGEWGGEVEIRAMGEIYGRPVEIYVYRAQPRTVYPGTNPSAPPLRLSYHWNSHYNSAINPSEHARGLGFLHTPPGVFEDEKIQRGGLISDSSDLSSENIEFKRALEASRADFENRDLNEAYSQLLITGAKELSIQDENKAIEEAIFRQLQSETQVTDLGDLERVLAESHRQSEVDELERAKKMSLVEAKLDVTDLFISPQTGDPIPIQTCLEMGFDRSRVEEAFFIFTDKNLGDDLVTESMINYLQSL